VTNLKSLIFVFNSTLLFTYFLQHQKRDTCTVGHDHSQLLQYSYSVTQNSTACEAAVLPQCMQLAKISMLESCTKVKFSPMTLPPDPPPI